jgi:hypothetical protein
VAASLPHHGVQGVPRVSHRRAGESPLILDPI